MYVLPFDRDSRIYGELFAIRINANCPLPLSVIILGLISTNPPSFPSPTISALIPKVILLFILKGILHSLLLLFWIIDSFITRLLS